MPAVGVLRLEAPVSSALHSKHDFTDQMLACQGKGLV